jgi:sterol desaturase/sphingolipid hydroxylase (fatty acid hydroxylase superfamily)
VTIPLIVLAAGLIMLIVERRVEARRWPTVEGWWPRAIVVNAVQAATAVFAGVAWDGWLVRHRLWSIDGFGLFAQAILGYFVITFLYYWWHRWRHEVPLLWRWLHQFHHSPQRIELITSFYKHPAEIVVNSLLSSVILYLVVGAEPLAAAIAVTITGLAEFVYHWNISTPHWLGYVIQRPESHCVHHQEGLHHYNYADLPLWDILFGTFRNPRVWDGRCGFGDGQEDRLIELLCGRDISSATRSGGSA